MNNLEKIVKNTSGETRKALDEMVTALAGAVREIDQLKQKLSYIEHTNRLLRKRLYGSSSEQLDTQTFPYQDTLFNEFELCAQQIELAEPPTTPPAPTPARKPCGRKPLPKHLPRQVVEHDLSEEEKRCVCGDEMQCIGAQQSEELRYRPAQFTVIEHHCKKYRCSRCSANHNKDASVSAQLKTAKKPASLLPKSYASASLLATLVTQKFCDYLPLYRLESVFKRSSIELSRQVMSEWILKVSHAVIPLTNLLQEAVLDYDIAYADETTLQVLKEPDRRAQSKSYMWCFIGGPPDQRSIIYQYHPSRKGTIATDFFEGYRGALHCDGYAGYNRLHASPDIVTINCMAHVRRHFIEALPNGKEKGVSGYVVRMLRELYKIEASLRATEASAAYIKAMRQQRAKPMLEQLHTYLTQKASGVPPQSKLGKAIQYALTRWPSLTTYLTDGRYEIDNNRCERAIKPFVMGRKAWLFANTPNGAHASARLYTLVETAKANHLEPQAYLEHIFKELPTCQTTEDYEALLPWNLKSAVPHIS